MKAKDRGVPIMVPGTARGDAALLEFIIQAHYHNWGPMAGDGECPNGGCLPSRHAPIEN
jgi:hypothetical protein